MNGFKSHPNLIPKLLSLISSTVLLPNRPVQSLWNGFLFSSVMWAAMRLNLGLSSLAENLSILLWFEMASAFLTVVLCLSLLPMPVSPSGVSWISAFPFRTCWSLDKLWNFQVGQATYKYLTGRKSETQELRLWYRHAKSFRILSAPWPLLFFFSPYCCTSSCKYWTLWKFQSVALEPEILWKR